MYALQRVYDTGPDGPELVLIHYSACLEGTPGQTLARASVVVRPEDGKERREAVLFLPEPPAGRRLDVTYYFSIVRGGVESRSPGYKLVVPAAESDAHLSSVAEEGDGNLRPAPGMGMFRLVLPLRDGEPAAGTAHYGFGAMRKKPSDALCRAAVAFGASRPAVVEVPEALSVLKNRPMPFFLYHRTAPDVGLVADKINNARITMKDGSGDVACALQLWSEPSWKAPNVAVMEPKNAPGAAGEATDYFFAEDRAAWLSARMQALAGIPLPRTYEAYVYGPAGSKVEYCYLAMRIRDDGSVFAEWRNREGGNWRITL